MIEIYAYATPNSVKVPIMLEELGLPYVLHPVNLRNGEQKSATFKALNPNAKVPVLVDDSGPNGSPITLAESGAILIYLAEKTGKLLPASGAGRARVFEQMVFHASGLGAAFGNAFMQKLVASAQPDVIERAVKEAQRTLDVLNGVLADRRYVAGDVLSIADIAHFGWLWRHGAAGVSDRKSVV